MVYQYVVFSPRSFHWILKFRTKVLKCLENGKQTGISKYGMKKSPQTDTSQLLWEDSILTISTGERYPNKVKTSVTEITKMS
jgi:hypothetical protein